MLLNFNFNFTDLDGNDLIINGVKLQNAGRELAKFLSGKTEGIEPLKAIDWARQLYKTGCIEVDREDINKLETFINVMQVNELISNIFKEPLISYLRSVKEKKPDELTEKS